MIPGSHLFPARSPREEILNCESQLGNSDAQRHRLAILVNTIAPYRLPIYAALAETFEATVMHGGKEPNRSWTLDVPAGLQTRRVRTLQFPVRKQTGVAGIWDTQYVHLNVGLLWHLPLFRPDAIFTNELGTRTLIALLYGFLAGVPVCVGWEGSLHSERHLGPVKRRFRKFLARHVQHWVSFGLRSREYLLSLGVPATRVVEVQNCVQQEAFMGPAVSTEPLLPEAPGPLLLSVGQLIPRKGMDKLIAACGRLASKDERFTLVLVGEGPEQEALREQAAQAGLTHFHLLPNQCQEALHALYRRADVFVLPTVEDVWGLVVSEALWAGLPVLCSRYAGCSEVVADENIFDPLSKASFDASLQRAVRGELAPAETSRLMTWQEVTVRIREAVSRAITGQARATDRVAAPESVNS